MTEIIVGFLRKNIKAYFKHIVARGTLLPIGIYVRSKYTMSIVKGSVGVPQMQDIASAGFGNNLVIGIVRPKKMGGGGGFLKCVTTPLVGGGYGKNGCKNFQRGVCENIGKTM